MRKVIVVIIVAIISIYSFNWLNDNPPKSSAVKAAVQFSGLDHGRYIK